MRLISYILKLGIFTIGLLSILSIHSVVAQFIPLPPPGNEQPSINANPNSKVIDQKPPKVQFVTTTLHEGKNVFKVKIDDDSGVSSAALKYVHDGQVATEQLLNEGGDLYAALIDIKQPSKIVEIQVSDTKGNVINTYAEFSVLPGNDIFKTFTDLFGRIANSFTPSK